MWDDRLDFARHMDDLDEISEYRQRFLFPNSAAGSQKMIYLVGNSLGLQPQGVEHEMLVQLKRWSDLGVRGHMVGDPGWMKWVKKPNSIMTKLIGAHEGEVAIMNTLSVNLHLLLATFYKPTSRRYKVLIEQNAFPSDQYVVRSQVSLHGYDLDDAIVQCPTDVGILNMTSLDQILDHQGDEIALILLGGVNYMSGQYLELEKIVKRARKVGAAVGFDLAHAAGNVRLDMQKIDCDFAAWCSYKYLNGGPGALGAIYVNRRHEELLPALRGWWGHDLSSRFQMTGNFVPAPGADRFNLSTMPLFSLVPIGVSLDLFEELSFDLLAAKSKKLTGYLEYLLSYEGDNRIEVITPSSQDARGAQLSLRIAGVDHSFQDRLLAKGAMVDWREPGLLRAAPVPLYNSFEDVWRFVQILRSCMNSAD